MKRCFADQNIWQKNEAELSAEESHHLLTVLRARPEETIEIFDGRGKMAHAELIAIRKNIACIKVVPESIRCIAPHVPAFILFQAIPKHSGMELIIQKATELGVQKIVPVITERVVVKLKDRNSNKVGPHSLVRPRILIRNLVVADSDAGGSAGQGPASFGGFAEASCPALPSEKYLTRWRKIVMASAKQCHAAWLPEICPVVSLAEAVAGIKSDLQIFGGLAPQTPAFKEILRNVDHSAVKSITLVIGPEGDLTDEEQYFLSKANFKPVNFGAEVLRVETAAIFGLSALNYEFPRRPERVGASGQVACSN